MLGARLSKRRVERVEYHLIFTTVLRVVLVLSSPFYRWRNQGIEKLNNLFQVKHQEEADSVFKPKQLLWLQRPFSNHCTILPLRTMGLWGMRIE